jgi:hypothetical protein
MICGFLFDEIESFAPQLKKIDIKWATKHEPPRRLGLKNQI